MCAKRLVFCFWKGRQDVLPWVVAAVVAALSESLMVGIYGGVAGALAAALLSTRGIGHD